MHNVGVEKIIEYMVIAIGLRATITEMNIEIVVISHMPESKQNIKSQIEAIVFNVIECNCLNSDVMNFWRQELETN